MGWRELKTGCAGLGSTDRLHADRRRVDVFATNHLAAVAAFKLRPRCVRPRPWIATPIQIEAPVRGIRSPEPGVTASRSDRNCIRALAAACIAQLGKGPESLGSGRSVR